MLKTETLTKTSDVFKGRHICGFCLNSFSPGEKIVTCPQCGAIHHADCWKANGNKCTTHGCTGAGAIKESPSIPRRTLTAALVGGLVVVILCAIAGVAGVLSLVDAPTRRATEAAGPAPNHSSTLTFTPLQESATQTNTDTGSNVNVRPTSISTPDQKPSTSPATPTSTPPPTNTPEPPPTSTPPPTQTPVPTNTPTPSPKPVFTWDDIGKSVRGRDLSIATVGYTGNKAVVLVGSIEGSQPRTRDLVNALIDYYRQDLTKIPGDVAFYFIPSINPDGNASDSRYNANGVDLNRNWDTDDWKSNAAVPGYPRGKAGAGGARPFSELETRALRDLLQQLQRQSSKLIVVILHTSVNRSQGEVYPGNDDALSIASTYADETNYDIEYAWAEYTTSGEAVTWCGEQGILALDVVVPASHRPSTRVYGNRTLLDITQNALERIAD